MTNSTMIKLGLVAALAIGVNAPALAWWSCPTGGGYDLQTRTVSGREDARCIRPATAQNNPTVRNCPRVRTPFGVVGASFVRDHYSGGADACVTKDPTGTASTAVPHNFCPNGGTYTPVSGANDVCRVITPASEVAVQQNVN